MKIDWIGKRKKHKWFSYSWKDKLFLVIVYAVMILTLCICIYPLYFTVIASFSEAKAVYTGKVTFLPEGFTAAAYELVFTNKDIWTGYANSIFYTVIGTCYNLFLTIPAAYALSKKRMLGRSFLMTLFLITMYFNGGMVPVYILIHNLGLLNTRLIMILTGGLSVYNLIVTRTFFQNSIPEELYEAARIDGANEIYIFIKMVIPLSSPIIAVMTLYYGVWHWSDYFNALIYLTDDKLQPLQVVLREILILNAQAYEQMVSAGFSGDLLSTAASKVELAVTMKYSLVFIASAPMLIAYPFVQKHFVKGIMVGSLKG